QREPVGGRRRGRGTEQDLGFDAEPRERGGELIAVLIGEAEERADRLRAGPQGLRQLVLVGPAAEQLGKEERDYPVAARAVRSTRTSGFGHRPTLPVASLRNHLIAGLAPSIRRPHTGTRPSVRARSRLSSDRARRRAPQCLAVERSSAFV